MKRIIDYYLLEWKFSRSRKPLLLRGARQIGKTYAARQLGATYESFVEVNLEFQPELHTAFTGTLDPKEIIITLSALTGKKIIPGKTLLFIDEIQAIPQAITSLRYFRELMPELHVIAAGSLLDFTIDLIGAPVGRVQTFYMHPVSFFEYLANTNPVITQTILDHPITLPMPEAIHTKHLQLLTRYLAIGGMPQAIQDWIDYQDPLEIRSVHTSILTFYRQDFNKYAKNHEVKYVAKIFDQIPAQLGQKFKYSALEGDYRKRELSPALDLLITAGIAHKVYYSSGQGIPLGGQKSELDFKVIFLDVGLSQTILKLNLTQWFTQPMLAEFVNKGSLVEAFAGQEIAAYSNPESENGLFYWHKENNADQAEIDYLIEMDTNVIPVAASDVAAQKNNSIDTRTLQEKIIGSEKEERSWKVKSGDGRTLKSMHRFLELHPNSPYGIKFSTCNYSAQEKLKSYPLYAIAQVMSQSNVMIRNAMISITGHSRSINCYPGEIDILQILLNTSSFEESIAIINYIDPEKTSVAQAIASLQNAILQNSSLIDQLCKQHKNLRIIQLVYQGTIMWQKTTRKI